MVVGTQKETQRHATYQRFCLVRWCKEAGARRAGTDWSSGRPLFLKMCKRSENERDPDFTKRVFDSFFMLILMGAVFVSTRPPILSVPFAFNSGRAAVACPLSFVASHTLSHLVDNPKFVFPNFGNSYLREHQVDLRWISTVS